LIDVTVHAVLTGKALVNFYRSRQNGVYYLQINAGAQTYPVYCHMDEIPGCRGGGWTLVMKIDGDAVSN
jgi:hypothetical protein